MKGNGFSLLICDDHEMMPNTKLTSLIKSTWCTMVI